MTQTQKQTDLTFIPPKRTKNVDRVGQITWSRDFKELFDAAIEQYLSGVRGHSNLFKEEEKKFLAFIGARPAEIYDLIEDWCEVNEPSFETILAITNVRYEYFVKEQLRNTTVYTQPPETFPSGTKAMGDFPWLPRIIAKARAKLKGELPPELMYSCGTDRPFLKRVGIAPEDFLKIVWEAGSNDQAILARVEEAANLVHGSPY